MELPTEVDAAWAAGFFDGEGCTQRTGRTGRSTRLSVKQKNRGLLDKFQKIVGLGTVKGPYTERSKFEYYVYTVDKASSVGQVLAILWPYLGESKREQALNVFDMGTFTFEGKTYNG